MSVVGDQLEALRSDCVREQQLEGHWGDCLCRWGRGWALQKG